MVLINFHNIPTDFISSQAAGGYVTNILREVCQYGKTQPLSWLAQQNITETWRTPKKSEGQWNTNRERKEEKILKGEGKEISKQKEAGKNRPQKPQNFKEHDPLRTQQKTKLQKWS